MHQNRKRRPLQGPALVCACPFLVYVVATGPQAAQAIWSLALALLASIFAHDFTDPPAPVVHSRSNVIVPFVSTAGLSMLKDH